MELELGTRSPVSEEQFVTAVRFGVNLEPDSTDVKKYIVAFLQALLLQREKLKIGFLGEYIQSALKKQWEEVLSTLEDSFRRLVSIQSGSLIFTLFCPTTRSIEQLKNPIWRDKFEKELKDFLTTIGTKYEFQNLPVP